MTGIKRLCHWCLHRRTFFGPGSTERPSTATIFSWVLDVHVVEATCSRSHRVRGASAARSPGQTLHAWMAEGGRAAVRWHESCCAALRRKTGPWNFRCATMGKAHGRRPKQHRLTGLSRRRGLLKLRVSTDVIEWRWPLGRRPCQLAQGPAWLLSDDFEPARFLVHGSCRNLQRPSVSHAVFLVDPGNLRYCRRLHCVRYMRPQHLRQGRSVIVQ